VNMLHKLFRFTIIGAVVLSLVACGDAQVNRQDGVQGKQINSPNYGAQGVTDNQHRNQSVRVDRKAARTIEQLPGIIRAHVMVGESNAYVAVETKQKQGKQDMLSKKMRQQIDRKVRQQAPNIQRVYISSDRNFVSQMQTYGQQFNNARPIRTMVQQFNAFVGGIFTAPFQADPLNMDDRDGMNRSNRGLQPMHNAR
jgi:YhcN/YlaJ family sporulation lipoprotein